MFFMIYSSINKVVQCGLLLLLSLFVTVACSDDDGPYMPSPEANAQRTLIVFQPWADDLQNAFTNNVRMMERSIEEHGGLQRQRLLVFRATAPTEGSLVEILYGRGSCFRDTLKVYRNFNAIKPEGISQVLSDVRQFATPATARYALIVGCHGTGWLPPLRTTAPKVRPKSFGGWYGDEQIAIPDFVDVLLQSQMPMDFICFDDCYMAGVEVAYDLRHVTRWLIGSACEMLRYGLPYDLIFSDLIAPEPRFDSVMSKFLSFYTQYNPPCGTLAAIDCSEVEAMAQIMREINGQYEFDESQRAKLQTLDGYYPTLFFDMGDYVEHLCGDSVLLQRAREQLSRLVPYKANTPRYYTASGGGVRVNLRTFSGLTISDPSVNGQATSNFANSAWWQATH